MSGAVEDHHRVLDKGTHLRHLLRGECGADKVTEEGSCDYQARYRKAWRDDDGNIKFSERCGVHVPEEWEEVADGERDEEYEVIDLYAECDVHISKTVTGSDTMTISPLDGGEPEEVDIPEHLQHEREQRRPCGNRGFIQFVYPDARNKTVCRSHARDVWLSAQRE